MEKSLNVRLEGETEKPTDAYRVSTYEARPTPSVTTGKITAVKKVNGTWLLWFNGEEAYCCTHGAKGTPNGCPVYNYSHTSLVTAAQYTPGDHYANQINIWGGLNQLSLGLLSVDATMDTAYDDVQRWVIANYPDSTAARSYLGSIEQMRSGVSTFAAESDYFTYIYEPSEAGWQTISTQRSRSVPLIFCCSTGQTISCPASVGVSSNCGVTTASRSAARPASGIGKAGISAERVRWIISSM